MTSSTRRFARIGLPGLALLLIALAAACGPLGGAAQPDNTPVSGPATGAPGGAPATRAPAAQPTSPASATTAPAATSTSADSSSGLQTVTLEIVPQDSQASYRVREQLARLAFPSDAVGSTKAFTGTIVARSDGSIVSSESKFQVDLSTLKSDENQRDNFIGRNVLQTSRYKYATFVPTAVQGLALPPKDGPIAFKLIGDLTIRDVTKPVTWDVTGTLNGGDATGTATTSFTFADFNLTKPSVFTVLSLEDTIKLELNLHLRRVALQ